MRLKYVDRRPMLFYLKSGSVALPRKEGGNEIVAENKEGRRLLKLKNGHNPVFIEIKTNEPKIKKTKIEVENIESQEANNGDRR
jgi:hypothetical protein